jgi:hypothetical protein
VAASTGRPPGTADPGALHAATPTLRPPKSEKLLCGQISYPLASAQDTIGAYDEWVERVPAELAVYGYLGHDTDPAEPTRKIPTFRITPIYNGAPREGIELLRPMLKHVPVQARLYAMTLPRWETTEGASTLVGDRLAYIRSGIMAGSSMTPDVIDIYRHHVECAPPGTASWCGPTAADALPSRAGDGVPAP